MSRRPARTEECQKQPKRVGVRARLGKALIQKILESQHNACYVLITCGEPSKEGQMQVELTFEGDKDLAGYLIESAQDYLHHQAIPHDEEASQ